MTFEQLYYFTEVYRLKSITRAADNLFISRPALSMSIRKLENEIGVVLFERLANGVTPTKAGISFYHSAQDILLHYTVLQQNMLAYAPQRKSLKICKISLSESLIQLYGQKIYDLLSTNFPNTYFDLHTTDAMKCSESYKNFTISIIATFSQRTEPYLELDTSAYELKHITTFPIYIWLSATSPMANYSELTFDLLKNMPFCTLKNSYNSTATINYLKKEYNYNIFQDYPTIDLVSNFIDYIEKFNYFTIDFPVQGKLTYERFFLNRNIICKETPYFLDCNIIYSKCAGADFYPIIADIFST